MNIGRPKCCFPWSQYAFSVALLCLLLLGLDVFCGFARDGRVTISARATDPRTVVIPDAELRITNAQTCQTTETTRTGNTTYAIPRRAVTHCSVLFPHPEFKSLTRAAINPPAEGATRINVASTAGEGPQNVQFIGNAQILKTGAIASGRLITQRIIPVQPSAALTSYPGPAPCPSLQPQPILRLVYQFPDPVITINSPGAAGIGYGFEGTRVLKIGAKYHLFTSELVDKPEAVKMRLGYWISTDRVHWERAGTLFASTGNYTGTDPRASLWSPMPVYNESEGQWNLFYVAFRSKPNTKTAWFTCYDGTIWRAISAVKGYAGIGGPYHDAGIVLQPDKDSESWEGLVGIDSFFPYPVGNEWYAFYGSAGTEHLPTLQQLVGLVKAPRLAGPWVRCANLNPVPIETHFIENPLVLRLQSGIYVAVYDIADPNSIGYSFSSDGVHWDCGRALIVQPEGRGHWADAVRTPLGLVPEGDHTLTVFYTGIQQLVKKGSPDDTLRHARSVGWVSVRLEGGS